MKRLLALLLCLALLPFPMPVSRVRADDSDIFGANIQPNIMIFLDSSGSMDDTIPAEPYVESTPYTCRHSPCKTATKVYKSLWWGGYGEYANSIDSVTGDDSAETTAIRNALHSVGYWSGRVGGSRVNLYTGNYLNYVDSDASAQERKIVIARRVLTNIVTNTEGVRFGLAKFTGNSTMGPGGAQVLSAIGSNPSDIATQLNATNPSGYTPLGGALRDIGTYYKGLMSGFSSPIEYACQPNFVIFMSDGLENGTVLLADQATLRYTQDHETTRFAGTQNVIVHTVGFAVSESERDAANDVLRQGAENGGGSFYYAGNEAELEAALQDAIRKITAATFMFATPVIPTTSTSGAGRGYLASFQSDPSRAFWKGYLKAYNRDANGDIKTNDDGTLNESDTCTVAPDPAHPESTLPCLAWNAGTVLANTAAGSRTIKTVISGTTLQDFNTTNVTPAALGLASGDTAGRDRVVNFVRGVDVLDEDRDSDVSEDRPWKLGDIYHSTPAYVAPPSQPSADSSFNAWRQTSAIRYRTKVVLAGANDGMLHAFRESDGAELWAFIPPNLLPRLKELLVTGGDHPYLVDSSPIVADVKIAGNWKTIVIIGQRRGGGYYHALDITDTTNPQYLWSFYDPEIVETWSEPAIGKVKMDSSTGMTEKYVAVFGGGYSTATNNAYGRGLFVVDVANGSKLWEYKTNAAPNTKHTGTCPASDDRECMNFSIASNPTVVDLNNDGYIDHVYIGDIGGQLWKFDWTTPARLTGGTTGTVNNADWKGKRFFVAGNDTNPPELAEFLPKQAIYYAPSVAFGGTGADRKLWVYFGTGDRNHPLNATATANRFYGIKDDPYTDMTNNSVKTESTTGMANATGLTAAPDLGWYYALSSANSEKVLASSDVFNRMVLFTTFLPTGEVACGASGTSKFYAVQMQTAFAAIDWASDDDHAYTTSNATNERAMDLGAGIASEPVITINEVGDVLVSVSYIGLSGDGSSGGDGGGRLLKPPLPAPNRMRNIVYWKENF
jgi:type IV pilus assembly protein PilY1